jgi:uncharacterized surface protein with fasciclin (FAS1) repeats
MKLKFLALILVVFAGLQSQAQTHMVTHEKNRSIFGLPIADIDSVKLTSTLQLVHLKVTPVFVDSTLLSNIDSVTHAVPVTNNLYNVISAIDTFSQFKTGIDVGELNPFPYALSGNYTSLVPTNRTLTSYGINTAGLTPAVNNSVISYHTLLGKYNTADFPIGENVKYYTANYPADSVFVTKTATNVYVNGVTINTAANKRNISASNGLVHEVQDFLFPPGGNIYTEINRAGRGYDSIAKLVARAAIADPTIINTLQSSVYTLLAPSNAAITTFLTGFGGLISNIPTQTALNLVKDHLLLNRKFFINIALNNTNGTLSYGGGLLKLSLAPSGVSSPTGIVAYYNLSKAVIVNEFDYLQQNGVIHKIGGVLTQ